MTNRERIAELEAERNLTDAGLLQLLQNLTPDDRELLAARAGAVREKIYGKAVYVRGLIEFSNICRNDCYYCGIRKSNAKVDRYRLTGQEILDCVREGYGLGFRTFVLQGGEDNWFTKERMASLIRQIKEGYPDCVVTLSLGERTREEYECWRRAGADRYLLRHETADEEHYGKLHPSEMSLAVRKMCLYDLKFLGYQVGAGFMVGSPGQTADCLAKDLLFLKELRPHMVGIGPFVPHHDTRFAREKAGSVELTLFLLSVIRILLPKVLLPATTALGTMDPQGREKGLQAGANVVMPNLSPQKNRKQYELYDNKICTGEEAAECLECLARRVEQAGYHLCSGRGDALQE